MTILDPPADPPTPTPIRPVEFPPRSSVEAACVNCSSYRPNVQSGGAMGDCRLNPPETHVILVPEQKLPAGLEAVGMQQGPQMMPIATWPLVQPDQWCAQHDWIEGSRDAL